MKVFINTFNFAYDLLETVKKTKRRIKIVKTDLKLVMKVNIGKKPEFVIDIDLITFPPSPTSKKIPKSEPKKLDMNTNYLLTHVTYFDDLKLSRKFGHIILKEFL